MVIVYRVPQVIPEHVRAAFEERGVRLRPGDRIVVEDGSPPEVLRELDPGIITHLSSLPIVHVEHPSAPSVRRRRRGDRPHWLGVVQGGASTRPA